MAILNDDCLRKCCLRSGIGNDLGSNDLEIGIRELKLSLKGLNWRCECLSLYDCFHSILFWNLVMLNFF